ncbi:MAG TPA: 23S rRNA (uracil(1939)-C(5))-methyltransferase RlmD, partial [Abditibacteriaceae bacterium]
SAKGSYARGRLMNLETASLHRVEPPCPYFARARNACGGCQWQHLEYPEQLRAKRAILVNALQRIGGVVDADTLTADCVASPHTFAYRNKADYAVGVEEQGGADSIRVGFSERESHRLVDIAHCPIQQEANNAILSAVRAAIAAGLVEPFNATTGTGILRRIVARVSTSGECLVSAVTTRAEWKQEREFALFLQMHVPHLVGVLRRKPRESEALLATPAARDWLQESVGGLELRVRGEGFFQVNSSLAPMLLQTALQAADVRSGQNALDLFCGVGLFALGMARCGANVVGIERSRRAIEDARGNTKRNGLDAEFHDGDAAAILRRLPRRRWDVVLLDPPRAGAAEALEPIVELRAPRIVYVSCDPATLARDVKTLHASGYRLCSATPLDLFPQTAHVETVARFELSATA